MVLQIIGMEVSKFSILCRFKNYEDDFGWLGFRGGVQPTLGRDKDGLWDELGAIRGLWVVPWCIGGDCNIVKFSRERSRSIRSSST